MSLLLAIDTSGPDCAVGLYDPTSGQPLAETSEHLGRGHAERLMPMIEAALYESGESFERITRIAVCRGPGSFTGVRVGLAAARGLALALGVEAVGVTAFEAFAAARQKQQALTVALMAGRGLIWLQSFSETGAALDLPVEVPEADSLDHILPEIRILSGFAAQMIMEMADATDGLLVDDPSPSPPMAGIVAVALQADPHSHPVTALYLRAPDAKPQQPPLIVSGAS